MLQLARVDKFLETTGWRGVLQITTVRTWLKRNHHGEHLKCVCTGAVYLLTERKRRGQPVFRVVIGNGFFVDPGSYVTLPNSALVKPLKLL